MNKNIIEQKVQLTIDLINNNQDTPFLKKAFFWEASSLLIFIIPFLCLSFLKYNFTAFLFVSVFYFIFGILTNKNISKLPSFFSSGNFLSSFFINRLLKKKYNITISEYRDAIKTKELKDKLIFYPYIHSLQKEDIKDALYYYKQLNEKIENFEIKKIATDKIISIGYSIERLNKEIISYNKRQKIVENILIKENIDAKDVKKLNKIKIVSI